MLLLKNKIMPTILLRRTKVQCADDLTLPPRTLILRKDRFDEREDDFYQALYTQCECAHTVGCLATAIAHPALTSVKPVDPV